MHTISDLSRDLGTTLRSLRFYEDEGLLAPLRTETNPRLYSEEQAALAGKIVRWRRAGIGLDEIRALLDLERQGKTDLARRLAGDMLAQAEKEAQERLDAIRNCREAA